MPLLDGSHYADWMRAKSGADKGASCPGRSSAIVKKTRRVGSCLARLHEYTELCVAVKDSVHEEKQSTDGAVRIRMASQREGSYIKKGRRS
jgi:hypothetical protein